MKGNCFGPNQFAYTPEHGARDALAFMVLSWILVVARGGKVAILAAIQDARIQSVIALDPVDSVGGPFSTPSLYRICLPSSTKSG